MVNAGSKYKKFSGLSSSRSFRAQHNKTKSSMTETFYLIGQNSNVDRMLVIIMVVIVYRVGAVISLKKLCSCLSHFMKGEPRRNDKVVSQVTDFSRGINHWCLVRVNCLHHTPWGVVLLRDLVWMRDTSCTGLFFLVILYFLFLSLVILYFHWRWSFTFPFEMLI